MTWLKQLSKKMRIENCAKLYQGVNSQIFLINDDQKVKIADSCQNEYVMINELQNMTTIRIPKIIDYFKTENGQDCLVTEYLQGVTMYSEKHYSSNLLSQIADYIKELQSYKPQKININTTNINQDVYLQKLDFYKDNLSDVYEILFKLSEAYNEYYCDNEKVLTHGDLHGLNIICDKNYQKIITILDYGSSCYDDGISDIKLFGSKATELLQYLGWENNQKLGVGYFFHVILRKLLELDYNINNNILYEHIRLISNKLEKML